MAYIPCAWTRTRLGLFVGDDLIGPERREVERHLILCAKCRTQLEKHEESFSVLRAVAGEGPVLSDATSVWPALERQIRESRHTSPISWGWTRSALALAATLALASLAVIAPRAQFDQNRNKPSDNVAARTSTSSKTVVPAQAVSVAPRIDSTVPVVVVERKPKPRAKIFKPKPKAETLVSKPRVKEDSDRSSSSRTEVEAMAENRDTH